MDNTHYIKGFLPYGTAAMLVGLVGGFSALLGPAFVQDLGLAYNNTTWTALTTAMSSAACAPILGKVADVFGRRRTLLLGLVVYTLGNVMTALAPSLAVMLIARFVLGIGTAAIAPVVISYILTEFPPEKIAKGFSIYMLLSSDSVVLGPTVGAWIIDLWGWRAMIWLCTILSAAALLYCFASREKKTADGGSFAGFDGVGAAFVVIFFSLALCIPSVGQNIGWNTTWFRLLFLAAALTLFGLISAEKKAKNPILPLTFIKRKVFLLSALALFLTQGLLQANMTNTIVFVNYIQPENSAVSGYAISVMYIGMALGAVILGPLGDKMEPKRILTGSFFLTGLGCGAMLLYTEDVSLLLLMLALGTLGFGLGANGTIFMKVVLSGLTPQDAGAGTGTYGLLRDLAAPFGVAVLVPMFTNGIVNGMDHGLPASDAAVKAIHLLAVVELLCVAAGILVVRMLPEVRKE